MVGEPLHDDCPACGRVKYTATMQQPCRKCHGPTIPPTPGHSEEVGWFCDACGLITNPSGSEL